MTIDPTTMPTDKRRAVDCPVSVIDPVAGAGVIAPELVVVSPKNSRNMVD